jgi:hypothetical protein
MVNLLQFSGFWILKFKIWMNNLQVFNYAVGSMIQNFKISLSFSHSPSAIVQPFIRSRSLAQSRQSSCKKEALTWLCLVGTVQMSLATRSSRAKNRTAYKPNISMNKSLIAVLRIRDVYLGSEFFHHGSEFFHHGSEFSQSRIRIFVPHAASSLIFPSRIRIFPSRIRIFSIPDQNFCPSRSLIFKHNKSAFSQLCDLATNKVRNKLVCNPDHIS